MLISLFVFVHWSTSTLLTHASGALLTVSSFPGQTSQVLPFYQEVLFCLKRLLIEKLLLIFCWSDLSTVSRCFQYTYGPPTDGSEIPAPSGHPIWTLPGVSRYSVLWDALHGLDLGPTGHVNGNCTMDLLDNPALGPNRDRCLQK